MTLYKNLVNHLPRQPTPENRSSKKFKILYTELLAVKNISKWGLIKLIKDSALEDTVAAHVEL